MTRSEHHQEAEKQLNIVMAWAKRNEEQYKQRGRNAMIAPAEIECAKTAALIHATLALSAHD